MTVLQGKDLYNYLDVLIDKIEKSTNESNSPHSYLTNFLRTEKDFLQSQQTLANLSFSITGFPSIESIEQDFNEIASLNGKYSKNSRFYTANQMNKKDYSISTQSRFEEILNSKNISHENINIKFENKKDSIFSTKIQSSFYIKGNDPASKSPLIIAEHNLDYQILWDELFTDKTSTYLIHNDYLSKKFNETKQDNNIFYDVRNKISLPRKCVHISYRYEKLMIFKELLKHYVDDTARYTTLIDENVKKIDNRKIIKIEDKDLVDFSMSKAIIQLDSLNKRGKSSLGFIYFSTFDNSWERHPHMELTISHEYIDRQEVYEKLEIAVELIEEHNDVELLIKETEVSYKKKLEDDLKREEMLKKREAEEKALVNTNKKPLFQRLLGK